MDIRAEQSAERAARTLRQYGLPAGVTVDPVGPTWLVHIAAPDDADDETTGETLVAFDMVLGGDPLAGPPEITIRAARDDAVAAIALDFVERLARDWSPAILPCSIPLMLHADLVSADPRRLRQA